VRLIDAAEADDNPPASLYRRFSPGTDLPEVRSAQHAAGPRVSPPPSLQASVAESRAVLVDGHHPSLANAAVRAAREHGRLCLLDGRSWQQITHHLLAFTDIAVCSADSRPRDHRRRVPDDPLRFLLDHGVSWAAITDGPRPIRWASRANGIQADIAVPVVAVADTLGAGDVFCGALMHAIAARPVADEESFGAALQFAARVAAYSCQSFATRAWMNSWPGLP
jgi:sugar/nucleoside kinase (ribokinase family)